MTTLLRLESLAPGTRIRLGADTGVLDWVNFTRARVTLDRQVERAVSVVDSKTGEERTFVAKRRIVKDVAPACEVRVLPPQPEVTP